jgi:hypothetical protein
MSSRRNWSGSAWTASPQIDLLFKSLNHPRVLSVSSCSPCSASPPSSTLSLTYTHTLSLSHDKPRKPINFWLVIFRDTKSPRAAANCPGRQLEHHVFPFFFQLPKLWILTGIPLEYR